MATWGRSSSTAAATSSTASPSTVRTSRAARSSPAPMRLEADLRVQEPDEGSLRTTPPMRCGRTSLQCVRCSQTGNKVYAGTGRCRVLNGEHGRLELPQRQGLVLGQGSTQGSRSRWQLGLELGEARSDKRGKPSHINGWTAGDKGSLFRPTGVSKARGSVGGWERPGEERSLELTRQIRFGS